MLHDQCRAVRVISLLKEIFAEYDMVQLNSSVAIHQGTLPGIWKWLQLLTCDITPTSPSSQMGTRPSDCGVNGESGKADPATYQVKTARSLDGSGLSTITSRVALFRDICIHTSLLRYVNWPWRHHKSKNI